MYGNSQKILSIFCKFVIISEAIHKIKWVTIRFYSALLSDSEASWSQVESIVQQQADVLTQTVLSELGS